MKFGRSRKHDLRALTRMFVVKNFPGFFVRESFTGNSGNFLELKSFRAAKSNLPYGESRDLFLPTPL